MTLNSRILDQIVFASMAEIAVSRTWSPGEDQFLKDNLAFMTDAEIGEQLGRSEIAVHLRWSRDLHLPSRSKDPSVLTARRAAELLGIDEHKIAHWVDMGLIPGRLMPGKRIKFHTIHLVERVAFRRWVLNPMNWVYFKRDRVRDPELKRMLKRRAARWGDEWWSIPQVAAYHGVNSKNVLQTIYRGRLRSFHLPISLGGRHPNRSWSYHYVLKSDAIRVTLYTGKGSQKKISRFTPAGDAWILKARDELGMTFIEIGRTMKVGKKYYLGRTNPIIAYRYRQLKAAQKKTRRPKSRS
jgi:hypothetical protein